MDEFSATDVKSGPRTLLSSDVNFVEVLQSHFLSRLDIEFFGSRMSFSPP